MSLFRNVLMELDTDIIFNTFVAERTLYPKLPKIVHPRVFLDGLLWMEVIIFLPTRLNYGRYVPRRAISDLPSYSSEESTIISTLVAVSFVRATAEFLEDVHDAWARRVIATI